jgi:hypothetical protein
VLGLDGVSKTLRFERAIEWFVADRNIDLKRFIWFARAQDTAA